MKIKSALLFALLCSIATVSSVGLIAKFYFKKTSSVPHKKYLTKYKSMDDDEIKIEDIKIEDEDDIENMGKRYSELVKKKNLTYAEKQELEYLEKRLEKEMKAGVPEYEDEDAVGYEIIEEPTRPIPVRW